MRTYTDAELQDETIWAEACAEVEALLVVVRAQWPQSVAVEENVE